MSSFCLFFLILAGTCGDIFAAGVPSSLYSGNLANPAGTIALQTTANSSYPHYFNLKSNYQTYTTTLPGLAETTVQRIYFLWRNDGSSGDMPPAAVDNISVSAIYCDAPTALALDTVTTTSATISWSTDAASSLIAYKADNEADWTEVSSATSPYELTNLLPSTSYTVRVAANCEDGVNTSPYITLSLSPTTVRRTSPPAIPPPPPPTVSTSCR